MASIRTRPRRDGSHYSQVLYRANGKQTSLSFDDHKKAVRFKTLVEKYGPAEAERIYDIERQQIEEPTVAEYCRTHIDALTGVEPGTIVSYERYLKNDITDSIGGLPLSAVSESTVSEWVKSLAKRTEVVIGKDGKPVIDSKTGRPKKRTITNSGKTIANKHGFLSGVFKSAVRAGLVPTNPCEHTRLPRTDDREEKVFLSRDSFAQLLEDIPEKWRPLTLWLVATGMRFGEATALTVGDVSVSDGTCRVAKAWKYTGTSEARLAYPKSKKSRRTINVAPQALAVVDLSRPKSELLFVDPDRGGRVTYPRFRH